MQKGEAKETTMRIPKRQTKIDGGILPFEFLKGAYNIFYSEKITSRQLLVILSPPMNAMYPKIPIII